LLSDTISKIKGVNPDLMTSWTIYENGNDNVAYIDNLLTNKENVWYIYS